jgi:prepilin-type N-terminal cleavage/methylation domain-containing protein
MTAKNSGFTAGHVGTSFRCAMRAKWDRAGGTWRDRAGGTWRDRLEANRRSSQREHAGDAGFTLAEVIVSIALFTVISFSVMFALVTLVKYTAVTQNRVAAANLARQEIEKLRGQNSTLSQLDVGASTVNLKGTSYTVTPVMSPAANTTCAAGASRNVTVTVTWNNSGTRSVRYDTVLSC